MRLATHFAAITFALGAADLGAQARVMGTVRDSAGTPVAGAEVSVQGTARSTQTDRNGVFQISGIAPGTWTVSVRKLGYAPANTVIRLVDGDNRLDDVVLVALPRQLDTVTTREQELWREYPLLREFEENRKVGLGQFVTRAQLAKHQGGFMSPVVAQMRGLVVVRGGGTGTWLGNRYLPQVGDCIELEDGPKGPGGRITPPNANCNYCFPQVYLDYSRISTERMAPNLGRFNPDQLEAMEIYLGAAETPFRYASGRSGCGVIVLHTRKPDFKPRVIAARQDQPTRSRLFASASASAGRVGSTCADCGAGSALDAAVGYTLKDRWVLGGRYGRWSGPTGTSISVTHALLEWYPRPDPGRYKWFVHSGLGLMSVDVRSNRSSDTRDFYEAGGLPSLALGTGMDIAVVRRFVISPFISYSRSITGHATWEHCVDQVGTSSAVTLCNRIPTQPVTFGLTQLGTRFGWR